MNQSEENNETSYCSTTKNQPSRKKWSDVVIGGYRVPIDTDTGRQQSFSAKNKQLSHPAYSPIKTSNSPIKNIKPMNYRDSLEDAEKIILNYRQPNLVLFTVEILAAKANSYSKLLNTQDSQKFTSSLNIIADMILREKNIFDSCREAKIFSLLVNAFSKLNNNHSVNNGKEVTEKIAHYLTNHHHNIERSIAPFDFNGQELSLLVNGFSKFPESKACHTIIEIIANHLHQCLLGKHNYSFIAQNWANLVNGFSKFPQSVACLKIIEAIANHLCQANFENVYYAFNGQGWAILVNGFSKFPQSVACLKMIEAIANYLCQASPWKQNNSYFDAQNWSNLVNGFSKFPQSVACLKMTEAIANYLCQASPWKQNNSYFDAQNWSNLVNGFSKFSHSTACQAAIEKLATHLSTAVLRQGNYIFNAQSCSNLINGFSKYPNSKACQAAVENIANHLIHTPWGRGVLIIHGIHCARLANGFSKYPNSKACQTVMEKIAKHLNKADLGKGNYIFDAQSWANLVNGFSKFPKIEACREAIKKIANHLSQATWGQGNYVFNTQSWSNLANGFSKADNCLYHSCLTKIAEWLIQQQQIIAESTSLGISQILKAFAFNSDLLKLLLTPLLARLETLTQSAENNLSHLPTVELETWGNLVIGMKPILVQPDYLPYRNQACKLLLRWQPLIDQQCRLQENRLKKLEIENDSHCNFSYRQIVNTYHTLLMLPENMCYLATTQLSSGKLKDWLLRLLPLCGKKTDNYSLQIQPSKDNLVSKETLLTQAMSIELMPHQQTGDLLSGNPFPAKELLNTTTLIQNKNSHTTG